MSNYPGKPKNKKCEWCGARFETTIEIKRFCSESHRVRMAQTRRLKETGRNQA